MLEIIFTYHQLYMFLNCQHGKSNWFCPTADCTFGQLVLALGDLYTMRQVEKVWKSLPKISTKRFQKRGTKRNLFFWDVIFIVVCNRIDLQKKVPARGHDWCAPQSWHDLENQQDCLSWKPYFQKLLWHVIHDWYPKGSQDIEEDFKASQRCIR